MGGERDLVAEFHDVRFVSDEMVLELIRDHMAANKRCRVSALEIHPASGAAPGRITSMRAWRVQRFENLVDVPVPAVVEWMPGSYWDIVDDMDVEINLPGWVAVFPEAGPSRRK